MLVASVPNCIRIIANGAKDLCDADFTYRNLLHLMCILFFGLDSFSEAVRSLIFVQSVSTLSRGAARIPREALLRRCRNRVALMLAESDSPEQRFVLITDDTLVRKFGASPDNCYWFDHCINATMKGRNYLVLVVFDTFTGQCFPVGAALLKGTKHEKYKARIEVLKEQLLILKSSGLGKIPLTADSWFADKAFFKWLDDSGFVFEIEVKTNRKITYLDKKVLGKVGEKRKILYPSISDVACSLKRNTTYSGGAPKQIASGVVRLFGSNLRLKFASVWNNNDSLKDKPFAIYVTNKTTICPSKIWALSRFRWAIECHFRKSKQNFSFDAFPTHTSECAFGLIVLGMFLICSLELQRIDTSARPLGKSERRKKYSPLCTWVKKMIAEAEDSTFKRAVLSPMKRQSLLNHLNGRKSSEYACLKPRDKISRTKTIEKEGELRKEAA